MENTAIQIVKKFQEAGYEAYFAGGSVRDMLMEKEPQDYDIATSANINLYLWSSSVLTDLIFVIIF